MKQTSLLFLSSLAGSAFAFVPPTTTTGPNAWISRSSTARSASDVRSGRGLSVCLAATQAANPGDIIGTSLGKPETILTPDDFLYEADVPDTPMTRKFGHLRDLKVKAVCETVTDFYVNYKPVVLTQFRTMVTEYIQSSHLTVFDARFKYDPFFGCGFYVSFIRLMRAYPAKGEAEVMFDAMVKSLGNGLDADQMRADAVAVKAWGEGKTEADIIEAIKGDDRSNVITDGFYIARTGLGTFGEGWETKGEDVEWFLYNRLWAVGLFTVIEGMGIEPSEEIVESWFDVLGTSSQATLKDMYLYQEQMSKVDQSEKLFKEIEIREKKRLAERLEEKAQDAIEMAELDEQDAKVEREEQERMKSAKEGESISNKTP